MSSPAALIRAAEPGDTGLLLGMFRELAEFEHLEDQLLATEELIAAALFGERPAAEALIAESEGEPSATRCSSRRSRRSWRSREYGWRNLCATRAPPCRGRRSTARRGRRAPGQARRQAP